MTLKEKFKSLNTSFGADVKYYHHNINECVKIADEFAIGFAEWLIENDLYDEILLKVSRTKQLLEIYKKEIKLPEIVAGSCGCYKKQQKN